MLVRAQPLIFWLAILIIGAGAGLFYNIVFLEADHPLAGMIYGICTTAVVIGYERGLILGRLRRALLRLPSLLYFPATEAILLVLLTVGNVLGGTVAWSLGTLDGTLLEAMAMPLKVLIYGFLVCAAFIFVLRMRDLIGSDVFRNLMLGRYHRPTQEERLFLFIDIAGSTAYAEKHGDLRAQEYISAIFAAFAEPVDRHRGAIDDYIGDLAIITWPLKEGIRNSACLTCLIDITNTISADAAVWQKRFGQVPQLRAALHGGPIVTAEIGVNRHKIAYFGDVVNTTARLEALSRSLDEQVLISDELLSRLPALPARVAARQLGRHAIRGRNQVLAIAALDIDSAHPAAMTEVSATLAASEPLQ